MTLILSHPAHEKSKTYLVQVEGLAQPALLERLRRPMQLNDFTTLGCHAVRIEPPQWLWQREPPVRERSNVPTDWLAITLTEGKNRQVRNRSRRIANAEAGATIDRAAVAGHSSPAAG